ncbi:MAG: glycoside hydrolase family 20 zincin-like fold domain-containing protein, partial [Chitinophaga rupis]
MKTSVYLLIAFNTILSTLAFGQGVLIPAPQHIEATGGRFVLDKRTIIYSDSAPSRAEKWLRSYLSENYHLENKGVKVLKGLDTGNRTVIAIITRKDSSIPNEGYRLKISPKRITLTGSGAGVFYGVQTLL